MKLKTLLTTLLSFYFCLLSCQIKVRLFTDQSPVAAIFTVTSGKYKITNGTGWSAETGIDNPLVISRYNSKIIIMQLGCKAVICDSIVFIGKTGTDRFSIRLSQPEIIKRSYTGDLKCFSDMETLLLINTVDVEQYIAGVVKAEGGSGKDAEYFKTQAVIARTYTYKYFTKHNIDNYNLCDDTHCQAFNGIIDDSLIIKSVMSTSGLVITTPDSNLIISTFHSNCGGETSPSEFAWVTGQSYLKRTVDPYCGSSRNAHWTKHLSMNEWTEFLKRNNYQGSISDTSLLSFEQPSRVEYYRIGSFSVPLRTVRTAFDLRSTFFSLKVKGDSVLLDGKGYGHGVGLCQEGAMAMAVKGFTYKQIINFYYSGVLIMDIKNAVLLPSDITPKPPKGGF